MREIKGLPLALNIPFEPVDTVRRVQRSEAPRFQSLDAGAPSLALQRHRDTIRRVVISHHAQNARILGSVAQGTDVECSDLDILVDPTPDTTLFDIGAIRHELLQCLGIPADALTPNALPDEFRAAVLAGAVPL